ncbi:cell division cycle regulator protein, putative [Ixodes scapularis]|uniref:Cell division cycle protein 27 homolog n=1 Tax=Ixodes scapularis TaxID=6945 RepID=B7PXT7_IXOSC|nr:cell division cycle regulator protein, putative [Ixodes scapularis]|eukprot:XP_002436306.1 cell division cycle regulator protein, putative [Ixodes scapularis]
MIYYKQQQYLLAEMHFKRALNINPQSSVLLCHIAVVQHALKKTEMSLTTLNSAMTMEPRNPLCKSRSLIDKRGSPEDEDNDASLLSPSAATPHNLPADDSGSVGSGAVDPDSSHGSSVADFNDMHLQSMESDEGF